ncbi:MAG: hypothetical protein H0V12_04410 [Chloroflexi bacterium]|nr:hypothetical protein [Chloroflexota bacterium]
MNPLLRYVLAIVAGVAVGSIVNLGLITLGGSIIPPPPGAETGTMEGLRESIHLFEPRHFVFPFLAHALGTLSGATVTAAIAPTHRLALAMCIGALFLTGGILAVVSLPSPMWFNVVDLTFAYLPMAWLGWKLGSRRGVPAAPSVTAGPHAGVSP